MSILNIEIIQRDMEYTGSILNLIEREPFIWDIKDSEEYFFKYKVNLEKGDVDRLCCV